MANPKLVATIGALSGDADEIEMRVTYDLVEVVDGAEERRTVLVHAMTLPAAASAEEIQAAIADYAEREVRPRYVDDIGKDVNAAAVALVGQEIDVAKVRGPKGKK